jgi:hypothetical protein
MTEMHPPRRVLRRIGAVFAGWFAGKSWAHSQRAGAELR